MSKYIQRVLAISLVSQLAILLICVTYVVGYPATKSSNIHDDFLSKGYNVPYDVIEQAVFSKQSIGSVAIGFLVTISISLDGILVWKLSKDL